MGVEAFPNFTPAGFLFDQTPKPIDRKDLLKRASLRNNSIPSLIAKNRVLQERREQRTALLMAMADLWYVRKGSELVGQENLEAAIELAESGTPLVEISNHQADADHALKRYLEEREGYREFANNVLFLGGLKMLERDDIRQFASAENMLVVPTPFDKDEQQSGLLLPRLTEAESHQISRLGTNYTRLTTRAIREAKSHTHTHPGERIGSYPESTRSKSKDGIMGRARPETNVWYRFKEGTYIVPVAIEGANHIHPPGHIPWRRGTIKVIFAEPYPFEKIESAAKMIPESEREQFIADYAFSLVANIINPRYLDPREIPYYKQFQEF